MEKKKEIIKFPSPSHKYRHSILIQEIEDENFSPLPRRLVPAYK